MAKLIYAHHFKMKVFDNFPNDASTVEKIYKLLDDEPSIEKDLMPKGKWEFRYSVNSDFTLDDFNIYCSSCGHEAYVDEGLCSYQLFDFCPYCGARMERTELVSNKESVK